MAHACICPVKHHLGHRKTFDRRFKGGDIVMLSNLTLLSIPVNTSTSHSNREKTESKTVFFYYSDKGRIESEWETAPGNRRSIRDVDRDFIWI